MKKIIFLLIILFLTVSFVGCTEEKKDKTNEDKNEDKKENENVSIELIDCGSDSECWEENLKQCTPAKFETGLGDQIRFLFTIKGFEGNKCKIYHLAVKNPSPDFEGTYYECLIPNDKLTQQGYEEWIQTNLLTSCTGTYVDASKDLMGPSDCMETGLRPGVGFKNDSITGGKLVKVTEIGDNDEITVDVDGTTETIQISETKTINGISIENIVIENGMAQIKLCNS